MSAHATDEVLIEEEPLDDQPEGAQGEQTLKLDELPDDPVVLKERLRLEADARVAAEKQVGRVTRRAERLEDSEREQRQGKEYWYKEAQRQQADPTNAPGERGKGPGPAKPAAPATQVDLKTAVKGLDLAVYLADDDPEQGMANLVGDLEKIIAKRGIVATPDMITKAVNDALDQREHQSQQANQLYGALTQQYPDLANPESELAIEANAIYERLIEEDSAYKGTVGYRVAAAEAAATLQVAPRPRPTKTAPQGGRDRVRAGQGGPRSNQPSRTAATVQLTEKEKATARQMGLTEAQAITSKQRLDAQRTAHNRTQRRA